MWPSSLKSALSSVEVTCCPSSTSEDSIHQEASSTHETPFKALMADKLRASSPSSTSILEDIRQRATTTGIKRKETPLESPAGSSKLRRMSSGPQDLRKWFFKASSDEIADQNACDRMKFLEEREAGKQHAQTTKAWEKEKKTENDRLRKEKQHAQDKEKHIRSRKCDVNGKLQHIKVSDDT
jgi:hypothetical protein